jgi:hypothetical protein
MLGFVRFPNACFYLFFFRSKVRFCKVFKFQVFPGFLSLSYQSAIGQANRRRTKRLELSANRHTRTFPNLTIPYGVRVRSTIGKYDEAGNTRARLYHQFTFALTPYALLNRSRNFYDRADKL